jgi:uncharacterized protein
MAAHAIRRRGTALLALAFLAGLAASALALTFPTLTGRVVDEAGVLDAATQATLTQKLADFEAKTTNQLVVVTLKSLQGTTIEDFGVQLGRAWKIGQKDKNNGVLLIVVPSERKVRIEVGYGLEGTLTDAVSRLIIENSIIPRFRANDIPDGITRGVEDIIQALSGDAANFQDRAVHLTQQIDGPPDDQPAATPPTAEPPAAKAPPKKKDSWWPIMLIVLGFIVLIVFCITVSGLLCQILFQIIFSLAFSGGSGSGSSGGGFSGGGGSFGGGGASGSW